MKTAYILACALLLTACDGKPKEEASDFGAALAARTTVAAEHLCMSAGFEDLQSCAAAPGDARKAAMTAMSMEKTYTIACAAELGRDRCDDVLMMAYYSAKK